MEGAVLGLRQLLLLACASATVLAATDTFLLEGEVSVLTQHVPADLDGDSYYLNVQDSVSRLQFKSKPKDLMSGDKIIVAARTQPPEMRAFAAEANTVDAGDVDVLEIETWNITQHNPNKDFTTRQGAMNISSLTFLVKICGQVSVSNVATFRSKWLNSFNPTAGREFGTMENYYKECSWGNAQFTARDNHVINLQAYDLGCVGSWQTRAWSAFKCGTAEIFGWMEAAKLKAQHVYGIDVSKFSRWILILPPGSCAWSGLASVGCGAHCVSWVKGTYVMTELSSAFHELGHNLGLQHATTPDAEYGDGSSTMGGCCGDRCFNAPNSWQLTWATPIALLNQKTLPVGRWRTFHIPALTLTSRNHVQIMPTWKNGATTPVYFFSLRQPIGWDRYMMPQYLSGVSVHTFNGTRSAGPHKSALEGIMNLGAKARFTNLAVAVWVTAMSPRSVEIRFCRWSAAYESRCDDGLDNDCNGLIDMQETRCKNICNHNGICEKARGETMNICPDDCPPVCGDGVCNGKETARTCPKDCPAVCGDCFCDRSRGESAISCPHDCPPVCGDGYCDLARGESAKTCPSTGGVTPGDCPAKCGDGFCDSKRGESVANCAQDCPAVCGDGQCSTGSENSMNCRRDCPLRCGDRFCDTSAGERVTCLRDCPTALPPPSPSPLVPPPRTYVAPLCRVTVTRPASSPAEADGGAEAHGKTGQVAVEAGGEVGSKTKTMGKKKGRRRITMEDMCGDGRCGRQESARTCPLDCPALCGDGYCDKYRGEQPLTCPSDCPSEWCGDGVCGVSEHEDTCAADCCPPTTCGDKVCQAYAGENCLTCPQDCAGSQKEGFCCGAFLSCARNACNSNGLRCVHGCTPASEDE